MFDELVDANMGVSVQGSATSLRDEYIEIYFTTIDALINLDVGISYQ